MFFGIYNDGPTQGAHISAQKPAICCNDKHTQILYLDPLTHIFDANQTLFVYSDASFNIDISQ